jgi:hypothetical protein
MFYALIGAQISNCEIILKINKTIINVASYNASLFSFVCSHFLPHKFQDTETTEQKAGWPCGIMGQSMAD